MECYQAEVDDVQVKVTRIGICQDGGLLFLVILPGFFLLLLIIFNNNSPPLLHLKVLSKLSHSMEHLHNL